MPRDPIFRSILLCLGLTVIIGAVIALVGAHKYQDEGMKTLGVWIVMIAGACYLFFRLLGVRQARREENLMRPKDWAEEESESSHKDKTRDDG
ncbi:MAG: hypothetical protein R3245_09155 [Kiloniellales bacterium]|nr:hypothetical protein [Kiloniellales bacterium]